MESTNYYAVRHAPLSEIKKVLNDAKLTALIANEPIYTPGDRWVVVEVPRVMGCRVPGDYSTFAVMFDPWPRLKEIFKDIFELNVEENQGGWLVRCCLAGSEKMFEFREPRGVVSASEDDRRYLSTMFDCEFERLAPFLISGQAGGFCETVGVPFLEMEIQDKLGEILEPGQVIFSSEISD
jgi:hypothetical protein